MEFFAEIKRQNIDIGALKDLLQISSLPKYCRSIDSVISENHNTGEIYCVWGQFNVSREIIRNGVRFALLDCPHAFAWTITYHEDRSMLVVHCTIDDREEEQEFVESIEEFVADWGLGLGNAFPASTEQTHDALTQAKNNQIKWNEVTTIEIKGSVIVVKDAMTMLNEDEESPEWPQVNCEPGKYIFEINVPAPFFAHRARIRKLGTKPQRGQEIGLVDIDHAFLGIIDYESFLGAIKIDYEEYADWTAMELDDELALNFSGELSFDETKLLYVKSGDGDGTYPCFELVQNGAQVGIECVFKP